MDDVSNLAIVALSGLTYASLQLGLSGLLLLYHSSLGKNNIKSKTRQLAGSFISGVGLMSIILLAAICFFIYSIFEGQILSAPALSALVGALAAVALVMWLFYYRRGNTTELWLPKSVGGVVDSQAKSVKNNTEAFFLGTLTCFAELPISIIVFTIAANSILSLSFNYQLLGVAIFAVIAVLPLIVLRIAIRSGRTVVDIQKWRVRNKKFLRIVAGFAFLVLAMYIFTFKVLA